MQLKVSKSNDQGLAKAQYNLGLMYETGDAEISKLVKETGIDFSPRNIDNKPGYSSFAVNRPSSKAIFLGVKY